MMAFIIINRRHRWLNGCWKEIPEQMSRSGINRFVGIILFRHFSWMALKLNKDMVTPLGNWIEVVIRNADQVQSVGKHVSTNLAKKQGNQVSWRFRTLGEHIWIGYFRKGRNPHLKVLLLFTNWMRVRNFPLTPDLRAIETEVGFQFNIFALFWWCCTFRRSYTLGWQWMMNGPIDFLINNCFRCLENKSDQHHFNTFKSRISNLETLGLALIIWHCGDSWLDI